MKEDLTFDTIPAKFCGMVEEYRLELAKKNWIDLQLDVSLPWKTICWIHETVLISKNFWFIKWLVDNDKIRNDIYRPIPVSIQFNIEWWVQYFDELEDRIIMKLSIQDNPIEYLISYLK